MYVKEFSTDAIYDGLQRISSYDMLFCESRYSDGNGTYFEPGKYFCGFVGDNNEHRI